MWHSRADVGTTYKRALPRKNLGSDYPVPTSLGNPAAFRQALNYHRRMNTLEDVMRKPRNFDAELKALEDKAKELKSRKVQQLGELVIATCADALSTEELAGALILLTETNDAGKRQAWARRGAMFFRGPARRSVPIPDRDTSNAPAQPDRTQSASDGTSAA